MSRYIKSIFFAAAVMMVCSCDLTRLPKDEILASNTFADKESLASWMNVCYSMFDGDMLMLQDADDFIDSDLCDVVRGDRGAVEGVINPAILEHINFFLDNVSQCPDRDAVEEYTAVAHFFRALYNFNVIRHYGDVNGTREEDMWKVVDEFWIASDHLSEDVSQYSTSVNRWVALAYLSRAALYEGTFRKYQGLDGWEDFLCEAVAACDEIFMGKKFSLVRSASYGSIFTMDMLPGTEAIFQRLYNNSSFTSDYYEILFKSKLSATRRFVNHFQLLDGTSVANRRGYESETFSEEYIGRDPRLASIILFPGYKDPTSGKEVPNTLSSLTGYEPVKFRKNDVNTPYSCYYPLFRYAEILLNYAEAKAELNGYAGNRLSQADIDKTINVIRSRAGMPAVDLAAANANPDGIMAACYPHVTAGANKGIILEIRRERTIELALEGQRLWDMLRWHEGAQLGNRKNAFTGIYIPAIGVIDLDGDGKEDVEIYKENPSQSTVKALKLGRDILLSEGESGYVIAYGDVKYPASAWDEEKDYIWPMN